MCIWNCLFISVTVYIVLSGCQSTEVLLDDKCVSSCPASYAVTEHQVLVVNATTSEMTVRALRTCELCDVACETCVTPRGHCLTCRSGLRLNAGNCELEGSRAASDRLAGVLLLLTHVHQNTFFLAMAACLGLLIFLVVVFVTLQACDRSLLCRSSSLYSISERKERGESEVLMGVCFESDEDEETHDKSRHLSGTLNK